MATYENYASFLKMCWIRKVAPETKLKQFHHFRMAMELRSKNKRLEKFNKNINSEFTNALKIFLFSSAMADDQICVSEYRRNQRNVRLRRHMASVFKMGNICFNF